MTTLCWLHLSDWHQAGKDFDRKVVRDALIADIMKRAERIDPKLRRVDFVVFSGDLTQKANPDEYETAYWELLDPVLKAVGLSPDRLFLVPGNHDLNREHIHEMLPPELQHPLDGDSAVQKWLTDDARRTRALEPFTAYRDFVTGYTGQPNPDYGSVLHLFVDNKKVALLGINSAWMCGRHKETRDGKEKIVDARYLVVGEPQIYNSLREIADADVRIAVLHHPFDWLFEFDRKSVEPLLKQTFHFILHGHGHEPDVNSVNGAKGNYVIISAGACYDRRDYPNAYNWVHLDLSAGRGTVWLRCWGNREWIADTHTYPGGKFSLDPLPKKLTVTSTSYSMPSSQSPTQQQQHMSGEITKYKHEPKDVVASPDKQRMLANAFDSLGDKTILTGNFPHKRFPRDLVDEAIEQELSRLRKARFIAKFDGIQSAMVLSEKLVDGEFSGGADGVRCRALAWCARILTYKEPDYAERLLAFSQKLGTCPEIPIASAVLDSARGEKRAALSALAGIDSPMSRSAAFRIVANHDGSQAAIDRLRDTDLTAADLDPDGKLALLTFQHRLGLWEAAGACVEGLSDNDFEEAPVLHHLAAVTHLVSAVPGELRPVVLSQVPFNAADFPLASSAAAIASRRAARQHFLRFAEVMREFDLPAAERVEDEFALWLELRDPDSSINVHGWKRLESRLRDIKTALPLVNLGVQFGLELDLAKINREIERQIALHGGGITADAAFARYALAFKEKGPKAVADYLARYRDGLFEHLDKKAITFIEIEMLVRAGLPERARERLSFLVSEGISETERKRLQGLISSANTTDLEAFKELFRKTDELTDLNVLILELEKRNELDELCEYASTLFDRTRALDDAECLARALNNARRYGELVKLCKSNQDFLEQSQHLRIMYCNALYSEGALLAARSELERLDDGLDDTNYRKLQISLGISLGNWNSLLEFVARESREQGRRNTTELLDAAKLGLYLKSPHARELLFATARRGEDDADILAAAYFLASTAGWDDDPDVDRWLRKAIKLSGKDGPIQTMSMRELLDRKPAWDRRESETWNSLRRGEVPIFVAGAALNRSLVDFMLFPALANQSENDPRRRGIVPAYSGVQQPSGVDAAGTIGMDATALLTLGMLDLLDDTLNAFEKVYLSHSTLGWLFEEKQKAAFHQPSRIRAAHHLRGLLATGSLERLAPTTAPDSGLAAEAGEELALLIAEAEKETSDSEDGPQRLVVQPAPVHRIESFLEEEADLTAHAAVLGSCQAIVDKLRRRGRITAAEEEKARAYPRLHERPWPFQPEIADGAVLYLSDPAIDYFLRLGILEKLKPAGFRPVLAPSAVSEADQLIAYEGILNKVDEVIERIRKALNLGIESGKVIVARSLPTDREDDNPIVARSLRTDQEDDNPIGQHPTRGVIKLAEHCDAIVTDDRFLNQYPHISGGDKTAPILTTWGLIDRLAADGAISTGRLFDTRTFLRQAGYAFVPVTGEELQRHLESSIVMDGKVIETAELRAIRENLLQVRMRNWLQLPKEAPWIDSWTRVFIRVLKDQWIAEVDVSIARARSDWLVAWIDTRGWAHCFGEGGYEFIRNGRGAQILLLMNAPFDMKPEQRERYWAWLEEAVLSSIHEQEPELFSSTLAMARQQFARIIDDTLAKECTENSASHDRTELAYVGLMYYPALIRGALLADPDFLAEYGLTMDGVLSFSGFVSIVRSDLFNAIRRLLSGVSDVRVTDTEDKNWSFKKIGKEGKPPNLALCHGDEYLPLRNDFFALSPSSEIRLGSLDEAASEVNLPADVRDRWREILAERPLTDDELATFHDEITDTPVEQARLLRGKVINRQKITILDFVPSSRRYFERLVGVYDGSPSIGAYAAGAGKARFGQLAGWRPYDGFLSGLLLSSHSSLTSEIPVGHLSNEELLRAYESLEKHGDRPSQLGAVEVGLRVLPGRTEIEPAIARLMEQIRDDDTEGKTSGFQLLSALFILVDGELARTRLFAAEPPFYRRLAALAQAALIQRQFADSAIETKDFHEWAVDNRGQLFHLQSFVDMRVEPRWNIYFSFTSQLKVEYLGRIANAARNHEENLKTSGLGELVLGDIGDPLSLCLPGPLEAANNLPDTPDKISRKIREKLDSDQVEPASFIALINSSPFFSIGKEQAELAAKALKSSNYRLANLEDSSRLVTTLHGLAKVAAVARSPELADELRILVRRYRGDGAHPLSLEEAMRIALIAAASHPDRKDWAAFAGKWLTELAFGDLTHDEGRTFHSHLMRLCHMVPELWVTSGRADAALRALNG
uniref:3',5'-cyclic AMP phosphodiesterase CpdA n=1 Tax=Candidatus Kentrum sp. FM TaxID=2126340 RepID=A0A450VKZ4_9GAMM|nr:MAG: 3',5'-cyclic AMP phosphodiesterase CpdA [Candidatus Kentron sp. FM]VFJ43315.1 MAG: 3',5'-cyclic AMP phosphodiesterase CpdA [Candidatus Kentron sp. FM]VFK05486.1 MAG: 3',5'-cyclic AMP phosphodiesterase CpdA [Candidatus Kentron sp. FM]